MQSVETFLKFNNVFVACVADFKSISQDALEISYISCLLEGFGCRIGIAAAMTPPSAAPSKYALAFVAVVADFKSIPQDALEFRFISCSLEGFGCRI